MNRGQIWQFFDRGKGVKSRQGAIKLMVMLFWILTLGFVIWKFWEARTTIIPYLASANYSRFIGVFFAYLGSLAASIIGWSLIIRALDDSISWFKNIQIFASTFIGRRLPGTLWYVGGRMLIYNQLGVPNKTILLASGLELIVNVVTGGFVGISLLLALGSNLPSQLITLIVVISIIGVLALHPTTLKMVLKETSKNLIEILKPKAIIFWFATYALMWVLGGVMLSQLVGAFYPVGEVGVYKIIGIWALSGTAGLLTLFLPSSFGVTEVTIAALLAQSIPLPLAGVIAILTRILTTAFEMILAAIFYPIILRYPIVD